MDGVTVVIAWLAMVALSVAVWALAAGALARAAT
jgi:hypothetical protein